MTSLWSWSNTTTSEEFLNNLQPSEENRQDLESFFNLVNGFQSKKSFLSKLLIRFQFFLPGDFNKLDLKKAKEEELLPYLNRIWDSVVVTKERYISRRGENENIEMTEKQVDLSRVKFPDPTDYDKIEKFNDEFRAKLSLCRVKLKAAITDETEEDPIIVTAYRCALASKPIWRSAVLSAIKKCSTAKDLETIMTETKHILEPPVLSWFNIFNSVYDMEQAEKTMEETVKLFDKIMELADHEMFSCNSNNCPMQKFFKFLLARNSPFFDQIQGSLDIEKMSIHELQKKLTNCVPTNSRENYVRAAYHESSQINQHRNRKRVTSVKNLQNNVENGYEYTKNYGEKFCIKHRWGNHTTNRCRDLIEEYEPEKQINQVSRNIDNHQADESSDDIENYGEADIFTAKVETGTSMSNPLSRIYCRLPFSNPEDGTVIHARCQVDTAADKTVIPFSLAQSIGIHSFDKIKGDVYSFDKKKCTNQFIGQQSVSVTINDEDFQVKVLILKPSIGEKRVLLGLDILKLQPFELSFQENWWNFRFKTKKEIIEQKIVKISRREEKTEKPWVLQPFEEEVVDLEIDSKRKKLLMVKNGMQEDNAFIKSRRIDDIEIIASSFNPCKSQVVIRNVSKYPIGLRGSSFHVDNVEILYEEENDDTHGFRNYKLIENGDFKNVEITLFDERKVQLGNGHYQKQQKDVTKFLGRKNNFFRRFIFLFLFMNSICSALPILTSNVTSRIVDKGKEDFIMENGLVGPDQNLDCKNGTGKSVLNLEERAFINIAHDHSVHDHMENNKFGGGQINRHIHEIAGIDPGLKKVGFVAFISCIIVITMMIMGNFLYRWLRSCQIVKGSNCGDNEVLPMIPKIYNVKEEMGRPSSK